MGSTYSSGMGKVPTQVRKRVNALSDLELTRFLIEARIGLRQTEKHGSFPIGFTNERVWSLLDALFPWKDFD